MKKKQTYGELLKELESVSKEDQMDKLGFLCLGQASEIFKIPHEDPEVYVWQHSNGMIVTTYDEGDGNLSFVAVMRKPQRKGRKHELKPKDFEKLTV